jgi:hypothetical protein
MSAALIDGTMQLRGALDELERAWQESAEGWDDGVRQRFEAERLQPLRGDCLATFQAIQRLSDVLSAARRACLDKDRDA